jgi:hypothetical protein
LELYPARDRPGGMPKVSALVTVLGLLLTACGSAPASPPATPPVARSSTAAPAPTAVPVGPSAVGDDVLLVYETRGGLCPSGPCGLRIVVHRDGRVERSDHRAEPLDPVSAARLTAALEAADWEAILAVPFVGECPVSYDGQEVVYTIPGDGGPMVVASCTSSVDPAMEPFATIQDVLFSTGG